MLELPSPAPLAPGRLRLLEPDGSSQSALLKQLIDGTYDKPFIEDTGPLRYLHFDLDNVQSVMRHDDPDALCLAYTRKMMTFLLFNAEPRRILQLGLGGGSLAKFCYRHLPGARITVLEIDPNVLALREEFRVPPDDERFRVVQADGVAYIIDRAYRTKADGGTQSERTAREDVIIVDACDRRGLSPTLAAPTLYASLRRRLAVGGVLVMNVCGEDREIESHIARIRGVFGERLISLPAKEDGNLIVMGFRTEPTEWEGAELDRRARKLEQQFGLAFPRYVRQMVYGMRGAIAI
ncbi:MAG: spermidine synthase-like protein [Steroidobacteraceae bacterium]